MFKEVLGDTYDLPSLRHPSSYRGTSTMGFPAKADVVDTATSALRSCAKPTAHVTD